MPRLQASAAYLRALDDNARALNGALVKVYANGTTTPVTTHSDAVMTIANPWPVIADAAGRFPDIYVAPGLYRIRIETAGGVLIDESDGNLVYGIDPGDPAAAKFGTVAVLKADDTMGYAAGGSVSTFVVAGDIVEAGPHRYIVLASAATDADLTTAGGVKLRVVPGANGKAAIEAFGCLLDGVADDTAAYQRALDSGLRLTSGSGTLRLSDTILLDPGAHFEGAGGVANYANAALKIHFEPPTKRGVFRWRTAPADYVFDGVVLKGFTIRGFGAGASACLDLPLLYNGDMDFFAFAGIDALARVEKWLDCRFTGGAQGIRTFGVEFYSTSGGSSDVTTTSVFDLYLSQGPIGYVFQNYAASGINIKGTVESVDCVFDMARGNVVNADIYTENAPRTDAGSAFKVGKTGTAPASATSLMLNLNPGIGFSTGAAPATCLLLDLGVTRFVKVSGYAYLYGALLATTSDTQRVVLSNLDVDNCPWMSPVGGIADMAAITATGFRPRSMQTRGDAFFSEYNIAGPNLELFPTDRAAITRRKVGVDAWTGKAVRRDPFNNLSQPIGYLETTATSGWTFSGAKLVPGELVIHGTSEEGQVAVWRSQRHSQDAAISAVGNTNAGSAVVGSGGVAGTFAALQVNDWVTVSGGYGSATQQRRIVSKASDNSQITLDTAAASTIVGVTVATEVHQLVPISQQGFRQAATQPVSVVTPKFIGEEYFDTAAANWWKSTGLTSANWKQLT